MSEQYHTPILFIIFNRPEYTARVFEAIRARRPTKLFIIADGPRTQEEKVRAQATRAIVENIDWPCEVHKNYSEENLGLKRRISSGITWFFEHVEEGIILEDDCLPHPDFFDYCTTMLERYRTDERVMMVTGDNFVPLDLGIQSDYFFSRYAAIWGWATWRRAWALYDIEMRQWPAWRDTDRLQSIYRRDDVREHAHTMFEGAYSGRIDTWGTRWFFSILVHGGLIVVPRRNLISNIGAMGTNSKQSYSNNNLPIYPFDIARALPPPAMVPDERYDEAVYVRNMTTPPTPLPRRLYQMLVHSILKVPYARETYRYLFK